MCSLLLQVAPAFAPEHQEVKNISEEKKKGSHEVRCQNNLKCFQELIEGSRFYCNNWDASDTSNWIYSPLKQRCTGQTHCFCIYLFWDYLRTMIVDSLLSQNRQDGFLWEKTNPMNNLRYHCVLWDLGIKIIQIIIWKKIIQKAAETRGYIISSDTDQSPKLSTTNTWTGLQVGIRLKTLLSQAACDNTLLIIQ